MYGQTELVEENNIDDLWNLNRGNNLQYFGTTPFGNNYTKSKLLGNLYNFIYQMRVDNGESYYPQWIFTRKEKINSFNI